MNQQFNNKNYMLVKVKYNSHSPGKYTYACKKKLKPESGMMVVVATGEDPATLDKLRVAQVTATTDDLRHLPSDIPVKEVVTVFKSP